MKAGKMDKIKPIVDAIKQHITQYDAGDTDYSVTTLQECPRIVHLEKRHSHQVPIEVWRNLPSLMGTAIHEYVERMLKESHPEMYRMEERLEMAVLNRKVSGAFDILIEDDQEMWDIKTSKAFNFVFNDRKKWTAQQNIYRYLLHKHHGLKLKRLNIIFWCWEWNKFKMMKEKDYPRDQILEIKLPVWSFDRTLEYIEERVQIMIDNENVSDVGLPLCGLDDYWGDPDKVAVMHKDKVKALRLLDNDKQAWKWLERYSDESDCPLSKLRIEPRPAYRRRCEDRWCGVRKYCSQFTDYCSMKGNKV